MGRMRGEAGGCMALRPAGFSPRALRICTGLLAVVLAFFLAPASSAQNVFQITSASPSFVPAGANGITLTLGGFSAAFAQGSYQVCFYTGYGSTAALTPAPASNTTATITVPASTIQGIPTSNFTAANGYSVPASIYVVTAGANCDGNIPSNDVNFIEPIVEPLIGSTAGSSNVPQTNSAAPVQSPPTNIVLTGNGFSSNAVVTLGSFGTVAANVISATTLSFAVPAAFAASPVGTTAAVTICNTNNFCSGAASPVTLVVTALVPSTGTLTVTPTPTTTTGTTTLTAQFKKQAGSQLPEPGVPSGNVTFAANGSTVSTAALTLDPTATLVTQSSVTTVANVATPVIAPASGTYATAQTISITDSTVGAAIYYTLDGSTPTTASQLYKSPFVLSATATVKAIATLAGALSSGVASSAFTIFVPTPTSLAFTVQPSNTATTTPIAPAVAVAVLDQNNNVITGSTAPVTIALASNPGQATLSGTLTVNAVNGVATFSDLSIVPIANGYTLQANSGSLTPATSSAFNITPYPITVTLFDPLIGVGSTLNGSFTLAHAAPQGGVTVTIASSDTSKVTVSPATVNVAVGGTTGSFTYTGVAAGTVNITASAPNYMTGSKSVTATLSRVSLSTIQPVAPGQSVSLATSLATAAPAGGVTVTFTSSNTSVATITPSVFIPAGQQTPAANPQVTGVTIGTATITATAPGYAPDTRTATVTVTAGFSPGSISINRSTYNNVTLNISAPAQTGGLTFSLTSDDPTKATVPASVTIPATQTSVVVPITGVADGSTTIRADSAGVTESTLGVNVSSQAGFNYGDRITGVNLQVTGYPYLPTTPPSAVTVTITSSNPAVATISKSESVAGTATLTYTGVTNSYPGNLYIQGQATGTATLTISAPGYTSGSINVTVYPSGFTFGGNYNSGLSTTTFSSPTQIPVYSTILNPSTLTEYTTADLNPGLSISIPVTSSNTTTGTITNSPVVLTGGNNYVYANFQPSTAGTTTLAVGTPSPATGFSTASQYTSFTATVTAPQAGFNYGDRISGVNLQVAGYPYLGQTPPSAVTVTVTSSNPAIFTVSKSDSTVGTGTVTYTGVTSAYPGNLYLQGQSTGTATLTISAPGYASGTVNVTVYPSGFTFGGNYNSGLSTTSFSSATQIPVYATILNPGTLTDYTTAELNPGLGNISVPVTSSNTVTGTITTSPVVFSATNSSVSTAFQPSAAGTTTIAVGTPSPATGFSTPLQYTSFTATVTAPQLSFNYGDRITGANIEVAGYPYVPVAPPNAVTVTVTSNGPSIATVSTSATTAGTASVTYTGVTSAGQPGQLYIQGLAVGSTTLTISAPGYTNGNITVTVYPSGYTFDGYYNSGLSTTSTSSPTSLTVFPSILTPGTLTVYSTGQANPSSGTSVAVTSSNTAVGTITTSPLVFTGGESSLQTSFKPLAAGSSVISITQPSGSSTPSQYTQINATVQ